MVEFPLQRLTGPRPLCENNFPLPWYPDFFAIVVIDVAHDSSWPARIVELDHFRVLPENIALRTGHPRVLDASDRTPIALFRGRFVFLRGISGLGQQIHS